jgi:hypothetical protein
MAALTYLLLELQTVAFTECISRIIFVQQLSKKYSVFLLRT